LGQLERAYLLEACGGDCRAGGKYIEESGKKGKGGGGGNGGPGTSLMLTKGKPQW